MKAENLLIPKRFEKRVVASIQIKQEDSNGLIVELTVSYGRFTASALMGVKKESNIWKIVLPD